jgi:peptidyl-prolyl cis-trans isomerase C
MRFFAPIALLALTACKPEPVVPGTLDRSGDVLSTVNGVPVTQGMVDAILASMPPATRDQVVASGQLANIKDRLVADETLYQEAVKQKVQERPEVKTAIALAEREAMINALVQGEVDKRLTDDAVKAWFEEHKVQFASPQVRARHILVKDEKEAKAILADVKKGGDFAAIAKEKSADPGSGKQGGDLGWFEKRRMVPEFADAAFAAEPGQVVGPVKSQFGYHIIEVQEKRESTPFDEVKDKLKERVRRELTQKYVEEIKKAATVSDASGAPAAAPAAGGAPAAAPAAPAAAPATK